MSIIKLKAKISKKEQKEKLNDEKLSDTVGGLTIAENLPFYANGVPLVSSHHMPSGAAISKFRDPLDATLPLKAAKKGNIREQRLGKLIGYCTDCKCPVYSVTRKNHVGHNVITGAGR